MEKEKFGIQAHGTSEKHSLRFIIPQHSNMRLFSIITCVIFILGGCTIRTSSTLSDEMPLDWQQLFNEDKTFKISAPPDFEIGKHAVQGVIKGLGFFSSDSDVKIYELSNTPNSLPPSPCSPSLTGASTTTPLPNANGTAEWGRVDFGGADPQYPNALCKVPAQSRSEKNDWQVLPVDGATTYALCSHKDGKTVVICISQMTQNEPLAKQIFDTFRWTK